MFIGNYITNSNTNLVLIWYQQRYIKLVRQDTRPLLLMDVPGLILQTYSDCSG